MFHKVSTPATNQKPNTQMGTGSSYIERTTHVPFVNNVNYLGVIFDKKLHGEYLQKLQPPRPFEHVSAFTLFSKVNA
jgi:hypothetical protein